MTGGEWEMSTVGFIGAYWEWIKAGCGLGVIVTGVLTVFLGDQQWGRVFAVWLRGRAGVRIRDVDGLVLAVWIGSSLAALMAIEFGIFMGAQGLVLIALGMLLVGVLAGMFVAKIVIEMLFGCRSVANREGPVMSLKSLWSHTARGAALVVVFAVSVVQMAAGGG